MNRNARQIVYAALLTAAGSTLLGCGENRVERHPVSGSVTYQGRPVPAGEISFDPDVQQGNRGPSGYAVIKEGRFETVPERGVVGGPHLARITGYDGVAVTLKGEATVSLGTQLFDEVALPVVWPQTPTEPLRHDFALPGP